jgi:uncharacterized protein (DUF1697 family)
MPQFVVLLRGVNVGKGNRVSMAAFHSLLESLGCTGVRTLLNSGNAVFEHPGRSAARHASSIHEALLDSLGLDVAVVVHSAQQFHAAIEANTLAALADDPSRLLVVFAQDPTAIRDLAVLAPLVLPPERFEIGSQAAYLLCSNGILESKAAAALLGKVGRACTTRNWSTVLKLGSLLAEEAA